MFYRICWKLQKIYLHIRVTNISLINTLKEKKNVKRSKKQNAVYLKWYKPKLVKFTFHVPNWTKSRQHEKLYCFLKFEAKRINKLMQKWYWILGFNPKKRKQKFIVDSLRLLHQKDSIFWNRL